MKNNNLQKNNLNNQADLKLSISDEMKTNKFEQLKKKVQNLKLENSERILMRQNIEAFMEFHGKSSGAKKIVSTLSPFMLFARATAFVLVGLVAGGSGLVYASNDSQPGDALYSVKINVSEEIVGALQTEPVAKIKWEQTRIERRINEIENIESTSNPNRKPISKEDRDLAYKSLNESLDRFNKKADELKNTEHADAVFKVADEIGVTFKNQINIIATDREQEESKTVSDSNTKIDVNVETIEDIEITKPLSMEETFKNGESITRMIKEDYLRIQSENSLNIKIEKSESKSEQKSNAEEEQTNNETENKTNGERPVQINLNEAI